MYQLTTLPVPFLTAFLIGILLGCLQPRLLLPLALGIFFLIPRQILVGSALLFGLVVGANYLVHWRNVQAVTYQFDTPLTFTGIVTEPPDIRADSIFLTIHPQQLIGSGHSGQPRSGSILVKAARYPEWQYGDEVRITGSISRPQAFSGFNYPLYLERFHIYGEVSHPQRLILIAQDRGSPWLAPLYRLRTTLEDRISIALPEPESSFLEGILLGSRRSIPQEVVTALQRTGTTHIIAISGANITILLDLLAMLLPISQLRTRFWVVLLVGIFITLLTGASASVIRGAFVAGLSGYLRLRSRRPWGPPFILLSMTILTLGNPLLLVADPGFQLSFGAFAGLAFFSNRLSTLVEQYRPFQLLPEVVRGSLVETIAATLGSAPVSLIVFRQLSLLGLIVNPLVLWLLPPITLLGFSLLLSGKLTALVTVLKLPLWLLLHTALALIRSFATLPFGLIHLS